MKIQEIKKQIEKTENGYRFVPCDSIRALGLIEIRRDCSKRMFIQTVINILKDYEMYNNEENNQ